MAISSAKSRPRAKIAALTRAVRNGERAADDPELADARRDLAQAQLADYIEKILAQAPPLTDEQRTRLAELLKPVCRRRIAELDSGGAV